MNKLIYEMTDSEIEILISSNLSINENKKKKNGEVFTPYSLINEMCDKLPSEVWSNPNYKWLDPCCGTGHFFMVIYKRLFDGLKDVIQDDDERRNHIINNMLYMIELDDENYNICVSHYGGNANIFCGSFLEDEWKKEWNIERFDVIVGNPPYNEGGIRCQTTDRIKQNIKDTFRKGITKGVNGVSPCKARTIWTLFVENSLKHLNVNKYLCFLNPASWISLKSKTSKLLLSKQLEYIRFYNCVDALKIFKKSGEIPLTYYVLKNTNTKNETRIYDNCLKQFVKFNIYENNFIPTEVISIFIKIYEFTKLYGSLKSKVVNPSVLDNLSQTAKKGYKFPVVSVYKKNVRIQYSNKSNFVINKPKLVLTNSTMGYPILDEHGSLFNNGSDKYYITSNNLKELKQIQNFLYTPLILYLITITRARQKFFNNKIFEILPDITKFIETEDIDDNTILDIFNLNDNEKASLQVYVSKGEGRLTNHQLHLLKTYNH